MEQYYLCHQDKQQKTLLHILHHEQQLNQSHMLPYCYFINHRWLITLWKKNNRKKSCIVCSACTMKERMRRLSVSRGSVTKKRARSPSWNRVDKVTITHCLAARGCLLRLGLPPPLSLCLFFQLNDMLKEISVWRKWCSLQSQTGGAWTIDRIRRGSSIHDVTYGFLKCLILHNFKP